MSPLVVPTHGIPSLRVLTASGNLQTGALPSASLGINRSPWPVGSRRDFAELMYLNFTTMESTNGASSYYTKITINTTAGFFELPNYMNDLSAGPLLSDDYWDSCGSDCLVQSNERIGSSDSNPKARDVSDTGTTTATLTNSSVELESSLDRGPLLTLAIALFGDGSFLASHIDNPNESRCTEQVPLAGLIEFPDLDPHLSGNLYPCVNNFNTNTHLTFVDFLVRGDNDVLGKAFSAAAFLANEVWLKSTPYNANYSAVNSIEGYSPFKVWYDYGFSTQVPSISLAGLITVSILLGIFLLGLLGLAVYGCRKFTWTYQLDTLAMMRIGAAVKIPFRLINEEEKFEVLDQLPGWIGDECPE